ncbi:MAG TPA: hypothetical protein VNO54_24510 [Streptosporangiaceae bacterium]|nr:hypothetical protein [Streptosporangiaceae bacterium]
MDIFAVLRRLIDAAAGRIINDAEHAVLHAAVDKADPNHEDPAEAAERQAADEADKETRAKEEEAEFAAWRAARKTAAGA